MYFSAACVLITLILLRVPPLEIYSHNVIIQCEDIPQTVNSLIRHTATVTTRGVDLW